MGLMFILTLMPTVDFRLPTFSSSKLGDFCINLQSHILM